VGRLDFETPDTKRFPCLDLAYQALRGDESAPAVLNAANEVAVAAFLAGQIAFTRIALVVGQALDRYRPQAPSTLDDVLAIDAEARTRARELLETAAIG
jgi:1-deoxy-D-xylulose-5-phosphate reductoisomerase